MSSELVIFMHIPKTAGKTLQMLIERQYPRGQLLELPAFGDPGYEPRVLGLTEEERGNARCVIGHVPFGLHESFAQPCTYITFLRDPVDRIVSFYHFVLRTRDHYLHETMVRRGMGLEEFALRDCFLNSEQP